MNKWINQFADVFREYLYLMHPDYEGDYKDPFKEQAFLSRQVELPTSHTDHCPQAVLLNIAVDSEEEKLTTETDESYDIKIQRTTGLHVGVLQSNFHDCYLRDDWWGSSLPPPPTPPTPSHFPSCVQLVALPVPGTRQSPNQFIIHGGQCTGLKFIHFPMCCFDPFYGNWSTA